MMLATKEMPAQDIPEVEKTIRFVGPSSKFKSIELDAKIVKAIQECPGLTTLDLEVYSIGTETAEAIGKALESQSNLNKVCWRRIFELTDKREVPQALSYLFKSVKTANAPIVVLDLSENSLDSEGIVGLKYFFESSSSYTLEELHLNQNLLGSEGAKLLSEYMCKSIENCLKDDKPMKLKVFECSHNDLGNDGASFIAKCLDGLSSLRAIDLSSNGIGPSGMAALSNVFYSNILLEQIILNENNLFESGVNSLSSCLRSLKKLQVLGLSGCSVGSGGVLHLAIAMKHSCPEVSRIDLSFNEIESNVDDLLDAMENKKFFEDLDISSNDFSESVEESLHQRIFNIKRKWEMTSSGDDEDMTDFDTN